MLRLDSQSVDDHSALSVELIQSSSHQTVVVGGPVLADGQDAAGTSVVVVAVDVDQTGCSGDAALVVAQDAVLVSVDAFLQLGAGRIQHLAVSAEDIEVSGQQAVGGGGVVSAGSELAVATDIVVVTADFNQTVDSDTVDDVVVLAVPGVGTVVVLQPCAGLVEDVVLVMVGGLLNADVGVSLAVEAVGNTVHSDPLVLAPSASIHVLQVLAAGDPLAFDQLEVLEAVGVAAGGLDTVGSLLVGGAEVVVVAVNKLPAADKLVVDSVVQVGAPVDQAAVRIGGIVNAVLVEGNSTKAEASPFAISS